MHITKEEWTYKYKCSDGYIWEVWKAIEHYSSYEIWLYREGDCDMVLTLDQFRGLEVL